MPSPQSSLVFSFVAQDKLGIVELLAACVKKHNGNWHESRLMHLNGLFSGLVSIAIPTANISALQASFDALSAQGINIHCIQDSAEGSNDQASHGSLELIGADRPGIVHEVSLAMLEHGINIEHMETGVSSAAMSGEAMFSATVTFSAASEINDKLRDAIDEIADQLTLDISITEHS